MRRPVVKVFPFFDKDGRQRTSSAKDWAANPVKRSISSRARRLGERKLLLGSVIAAHQSVRTTFDYTACLPVASTCC